VNLAEIGEDPFDEVHGIGSLRMTRPLDSDPRRRNGRRFIGSRCFLFAHRFLMVLRLRHFPKTRGVAKCVPCGFFLRKNPLRSCGLAFYQFGKCVRAKTATPDSTGLKRLGQMIPLQPEGKRLDVFFLCGRLCLSMVFR